MYWSHICIPRKYWNVSEEVAVGHISLYSLVVPDAVNRTDMIANRISGIYGVSDSRQTFH